MVEEAPAFEAGCANVMAVAASTSLRRSSPPAWIVGAARVSTELENPTPETLLPPLLVLIESYI